MSEMYNTDVLIDVDRPEHAPDGSGRELTIPSQSGPTETHLGADTEPVSTVNSLETISVSEDALDDYLRSIGKTRLLTPTQEVELSKRIQTGQLAAAKLADQVTPTEGLAHELSPVIADGEIARRQLIEANLRLVVHIAKRYIGQGVAFIDLIQEGNIGLMRAADKFDHTRGTKFSTLASWWIREAIVRAQQEQRCAVHLPINQVDALNKARHIVRRAEEESRRRPTDKELAAELKVNARMFTDARDIDRPMRSLSEPLQRDEDITLANVIKDDGMLPDELVLKNFEIKALYGAIKDLSWQETVAVSMAFGLEDGEPKAMKEIGVALGGLTAEGARLIKVNALKKLRSSLAKNDL